MDNSAPVLGGDPYCRSCGPATRNRAITAVTAVAAVSLIVLCSLVGGSRADAARTGAVAAAVVADPVIAAAGDISCDPLNSNYHGGTGTGTNCAEMATSNMLVNGNFAAAIALGDNQYYCGSLAAYQQSFDPSWGRVKPIIRPSLGNHEYITSGASDATGCNSTNSGAAGYFSYFGAAGAGVSGKGYYSYDVGTWHIIVLNSQCGPGGGCSPGTQQETWLRQDLAAHQNFCTLAYWHVPLFSSGGRAASNSQPWWQDLYNANADVVLNGHDHIYERFAPQNPAGSLDPARGIREFIAGTGGANHTSIAKVAANSEVRDTTTYGLLELTLHATSYDWQFVPAPGTGTFVDSGSAPCHGTQTDTLPPTAPTGLAASAASPSELDLTWTASTDNVGVTGYRVFRDGTQLTTVTGTSFADTGLVPATTHSYQVYAVDAVGNVSPASNTTTATTLADTTPPTTPSALAATVASSAEVDLSWTGSTDNVGVDHYAISRNGAVLADSTTTSFADKTAVANTTYTYAVSAVDVAGNVSAASNGVTITTPPPPTVLTFPAVADTYVQQDKATTNFGTSSLLVVDGSPIDRMLLKFVVSGTGGRTVVSAKLRVFCSDDSSSASGEFHRVPDTSWSENSVTWNTAPAFDPAMLGSIGSTSTNTWAEVDVTPAVSGDGTVSIGALSANSNGVHYASREAGAATTAQLVVTVSGPADTTPPTQPGSPSVTGTTDTTADLAWTASTDEVGVDHYEIDRDGAAVGTSATTSFHDIGLAPTSLYHYRVVAVDAAGNRSTGATVDATTAPDTVSPSAPTGLAALVVSATQVQLTWNAASDDVGVTAYRVYRSGTLLGTPTATGFTDATVASGASYTYTVTALDAAGNESPASTGLAVTTPAAADTIPPTQPGSPSVTGTTDTTVDLAWSASTDDVGVHHYEVDRDGAAVANVTTTSFHDSGRAPSTLYHYAIVAVDSAGNRSAAAALDATTAPDTTPPTAPAGLTAPAVGSNQVQLAWNAATDDVGVAGYRVYRDGAPLASAVSTGYADLTVAPGTSYTYTVTALDAAGNESAASTPLAVTTPGVGTQLFADGFESGDMSRWSTVNGISAQQALVFDGLWGTRMTSSGGATPTYAYGTLSSTATEVSYSLQFLVAGQGVNTVNLVRLRTATGSSLGAVYLTSTGRLALRNDIASVSTTSTATVSQGTWHSLKLHFLVGDTTGSAEDVWLDGVKVDALSRTDTLGTNPIGIVQLGEAATGKTYDVAYDDVQVTSP